MIAVFHRDAASYAAMLKNLLPVGVIWNRADGSMLSRFLAGCAEELSRLDGEAFRLIDEADPQSTVDLLEDWERVLGLPDECGQLGETLQERRAAVIQKLVRPVGQTPSYYIMLAETLGYEGVSVETHVPFRVDEGRVGGRLYQAPGGVTLDYSQDTPAVITDQYLGWLYVWTIRVADQQIRYFRVDTSLVGERLRSWGDERLECLINKYKPAHTLVLFAYGDDDQEPSAAGEI